MRSDDVRAEFTAVMLELDELKLNYDDPVIARLHAAYLDDMRAALKHRSPRASTSKLDEPALRKKLGKEGDTIAEKHMPAMQARAGDLYATQRRLRERLVELAPTASIHVVDVGEWRRLDSRRASDYSSQGYGADRYAEGSVELSADVARDEGVKVRVVKVDGTWVAEVLVESDVDVQILRRLSLSMREFVRRCWGRGLNPRVFQPFLPHGFEEKAGLDYFGRDLRKVV